MNSPTKDALSRCCDGILSGNLSHLEARRTACEANILKELSNNNDSSSRLGGTVSASIFSMMQGVQILRVHDVNEIKQSIKVFNELIK